MVHMLSNCVHVQSIWVSTRETWGNGDPFSALVCPVLVDSWELVDPA